jgi:hypothetical protein
MVHEVDPGAHQLKAVMGAEDVASHGFTVPDGSAYRGLISLGGQREYIVVRAVYSTAGGDTQFHAVSLADGVATLPSDVAPDGLDLTFPNEMSTSGDSVTLTYVCHYDSRSETVGCPGA